MAGGIAVQPGGPPAPAPGAPDESQNTSGFLSLLARMGNLGHPWSNPYADPASAIVNNAIAAPSPDDGQRTRGMPQSYPKGAPPLSTSMAGTPPPSMVAPRPAPVPQSAPSSPAVAPGTGAPPGPGAPPPSVPEDASQRVGMGTGPGVSHEQAAAIGGAATNLGSQVASDPSITSQIIKDLSTKGLANNSQDAWMALAQAGFAMAASRSPFPLQAMGEGASAGLQAYNQMRGQRAQQLYTAGELQNRQEALQQQGQYQKATIGIEQKKADLMNKDFDQKVHEFAQTLPLEQAKTAALVEYYKSHGDYFERRGTGPGSGAGAGGATMQLVNALMATDPTLTFADALQRAKTGKDPAVELAKSIYANDVRGGSFDDAMVQARQVLGRPAPGATVAPAAAAAPAAAGAMPAGALGVATGQPDGATGNKGAAVARGGFWYPAQ